MEKIILEKISEEIERRFNCKVLHISLCSFFGTPNVQCKILNALNKAAKKDYSLKDLFNYKEL